MIIPMRKYTFMVFHKEYKKFLNDIQHIGVLHVVEKDVNITDEIKQKYEEVSQFDKIIEFLKNREPAESKRNLNLNGFEIIKSIKQKQTELEELILKLENTKKESLKSKPWGNFSPEIINKLKEEKIYLQFRIASKKKFQEFQKEGILVEQISEHKNQIYFLLFQHDNNKIDIDAEEVQPVPFPYSELEEKRKKIEYEIDKINNCLDEYAGNSISFLEACKKEKVSTLQFDNVILNTSAEADEKLMILEGWVPETKKNRH